MSFLRRPHKKTRTGCSMCKKRRIKCDESKPSCIRCIKRRLTCKYELKHTTTNIDDDSGEHDDDIPALSELAKVEQFNYKIDSDHYKHQDYISEDGIIPSTSITQSNPPLNSSPSSSPSSSSSTSSALPSQTTTSATYTNAMPHIPLGTIQIHLDTNGINQTHQNNNIFQNSYNIPNNNDSKNQRDCTELQPNFDHQNAIHHPNISLPQSFINLAKDSQEFLNNDNPLFSATPITNNVDVDDDKTTTIVNGGDALNNSINRLTHSTRTSSKTSATASDLFGFTNSTTKMQLYTFYTESTLKLHYHMVNTLPYRVCRDPINRNLLMKGLQYCPLYDYLWHAFMAVNCIDLYYQKETCGIDDVLNLSKDAYLNMGDYHMTRSMLSLAEEVKKQEDAKKAVSLVLTTMLHIFYATGSPNQMIADRAYFGLGKNLGLLFTEYAVMFSKCTIFNQACARYCINEWSEDAINYFPEFLYGLIDVEYEDTNEPNEPNNKQKVKPLSNDCKIMLKTMVDRLKREFRSFANPTIYRNPIMSSRYVPIDSLLNKDDDLSNDDGLNNNVKKLEYDMYGTMSRYIVEIPDLFIEMQEMNDPRALLITAYNVISLVSRRYEYWPISVYRRELDYIKSLLTKLENENLWIRWMDVAYNVLDGLENETTSH